MTCRHCPRTAAVVHEGHGYCPPHFLSHSTYFGHVRVVSAPTRKVLAR